MTKIDIYDMELIEVSSHINSLYLAAKAKFESYASPSDVLSFDNVREYVHAFIDFKNLSKLNDTFGHVSRGEVTANDVICGLRSEIRLINDRLKSGKFMDSSTSMITCFKSLYEIEALGAFLDNYLTLLKFLEKCLGVVEGEFYMVKITKKDRFEPAVCKLGFDKKYYFKFTYGGEKEASNCFDYYSLS